MKHICLIVVLFISVNFVYADWDLFPLNQRSYYQYTGLNDFKEKVNLIAFDTIVQRSGFKSAFRNRKYSGNGNEQCYSELTPLDPYNLPGYNWMETELDSLVFASDTVFFNHNLYFLPKLFPGESWRNSTGSSQGFTDIEFTCTNVSLQTFFGLTDSVKEFMLTTYNGVVPYNSLFSGYVIRLSKNYGLLNYPAFYDLGSHFFEPHHLIGLADSSGSYGFQAPTYLDFFPYQVGDILNWIDEEHPFGSQNVTSYFRDSVISVTIDPDTLKYSVLRKRYNVGTSAFLVSTEDLNFPVNYFKSITECPTNWLTINDQFGPSQPAISFTNSYVVESDSSISYRIIEDGYLVDTANCLLWFPVGLNEHLTFNTKRGLVEDCIDEVFFSCTRLIGSTMGGVVLGDTNLVTSLVVPPDLKTIKAFPNPSSNSFVFQSSVENGKLIMYNSHGSICKEVVITKDETLISIDGMEAGLYFLRYVDETNKEYLIRFVCIP